MRNAKLAIVGTVMLLTLASCFRVRKLASQPAEELPPVTLSGIPYVPADQPPLIKTQDGYVTGSLPGVKPLSPTPYTYTTYVGPSN